MNGVEGGRRGIHILYKPSGGLGCRAGKHLHVDGVGYSGGSGGRAGNLPLTAMVQTYSKHGPTQVNIHIYTHNLLLQSISRHLVLSVAHHPTLYMTASSPTSLHLRMCLFGMSKRAEWCVL